MSATPLDPLLAALTEALGVPQQAYPDVDQTMADRCEWHNDGFTGLEPIGYTMPGTVTIGRQGVEYQVSIYGASELEVLARAAQLAGKLDRLVGPPQGAPPPAGHGYKVGRSSKPVRGGDGTSAGWSTVLPVTLFQPVYSEVRPLLTVAHPSITTTAQAGNGVGPDSLPIWQG
jgi:hypothetical protein